MLKSIRCLMIVPACLLAGCGGSSANLPLAKSPHDGVLVTLPGGRGFVEILVESGFAGSGGRKSHDKSRIVACFLQPDGTTAMSPGPDDVKVKVGTGENSPVVALSPLPNETDKYASEPGTIPDGFRGQVDAKINGELVQVSFTIR